MEGFGFFSRIIEGVLFNTKAATVTEIFLWLIFLLFLFGFVIFWLQKADKFIRELPTLLTSLGILGTFVGIVVGLMHFDPQNIDNSISSLLEGLKTAFVTSLVGMGSAILFKTLTAAPWLSKHREQEALVGAGPDDILRALLDQNNRLDQLRNSISGAEETSLVGQFRMMRVDGVDHHKEMMRSTADISASISGDEKTSLLAKLSDLHEDQNQKIIRAINDLRSSISGSEETSLVGQFKLMRMNDHDHHKEMMEAINKYHLGFEKFSEKLWDELDEFAEMLSKSATEQMMNALKEVISDFNKNLTEQFGDNFKALDASVKKLVDWQENYRVQLEQMSSQYAQGVEAITKTEASVAHISIESQQIPAAMEKLKAVMLVNQHQLSELRNHLEAFREMKEKAIEAVPEIRSQVEKTVGDISAAAQAANAHYSDLLDKSEKYIQEHDEKTRELLEKLVLTAGEGIEKVRIGLESGANDVKTAIASSAEEFGQNVQNLLSDVTGKVTVSVESASDHYTKLLDQSDAYIKSHDQKSQELLAKFSESTEAGIEKIRSGLEVSANEIKAAISSTAESFASNVQSLISDTTNKITNSVELASNHYEKLLENSDAYIEAHDQKSQELLDRFVKNTNESIGKVKESLEAGASAVKTSIITGAEEFDSSVQRLQGNLTNTSDQIAMQNERIREQFEDTFKDVNEHVRVMLATLSDESKSLSSTLKSTGEQVQRDTHEVQKQVSESIKQMQARLESSLNEVFEAQARAMSRASEGLEDHMKHAIAKTGDGVNAQLSAIDQAMQKEIERVMSEMGRALAQIAGKFTQDYTQLVGAMQVVIEQSSQVQQTQRVRN